MSDQTFDVYVVIEDARKTSAENIVTDLLYYLKRGDHYEGCAPGYAGVMPHGYATQFQMANRIRVMLRAGEVVLDDAVADFANMPIDRLVDLHGAWEFAAGKEGAAGLVTDGYLKAKANADAFRSEVVRRFRTLSNTRVDADG